MNDFKTYWEDYKQTNPGWRKLDPQDLALIGWIGRNAEIEYFRNQVIDLIAIGQKLHKEVLQLKVDLARLKAKREVEGE